MRRAIPALAAAAMAVALLPGCDNSANPVGVGTEVLDYVYIEGESCAELVAGQTTVVGNVCVDLVGPEFGQTLRVTYHLIDGWELIDAHMWIGESIADMPQTRKGNPKIGLFPYYSGDITSSTSWTFQVPLADLGNEPYICEKAFHIAAHAELRKDLGGGEYRTETAWCAGEQFVERGSWGTYFTILFTCDPLLPIPILKCGTAFAHGGTNPTTCFQEIDEDGDGVPDFTGWGWTSGPLGPGVYQFDLYTGAARCNLTRASLVGTLTVDYNGSVAIVTYDLFDDYTMRETNLWVGPEILARNSEGDFTIAPGDYPLIHENLDGTHWDQFVITGLSGDINVVAHAVVCVYL
jgi:hypothetical protein